MGCVAVLHWGCVACFGSDLCLFGFGLLVVLLWLCMLVVVLVCGGGCWLDLGCLAWFGLWVVWLFWFVACLVVWLFCVLRWLALGFGLISALLVVGCSWRLFRCFDLFGSLSVGLLWC